MNTEYLDLILIHSPPDTVDARNSAWRCLEEFYEAGKTRAIGVSNYEIHHLEELSMVSKVKPHVNQIYYNPLVSVHQFDLVNYCSNHNIHITSYTSLGRTSPNLLLINPALHKIANR